MALHTVLKAVLAVSSDILSIIDEFPYMYSNNQQIPLGPGDHASHVEVSARSITYGI
jgi:hypothetical protein